MDLGTVQGLAKSQNLVSMQDPTGELVTRFGLERNVGQEVDTLGSSLYSLACSGGAARAAGGCALNTARVFCWLVGRAGSTAYLGGVGEDEAGGELAALVEGAGMRHGLTSHPDTPTGHCVTHGTA